MPAGNPNWVKGGASPNPTGLSKKVVALRKSLEGLGAKARKVIDKALGSADEEIAMEAAKIVFTYTVPKPTVTIDAKVINTSAMTTAELYAAWRAEHPRKDDK